jgi:hypothetical protein
LALEAKELDERAEAIVSNERTVAIMQAQIEVLKRELAARKAAFERVISSTKIAHPRSQRPRPDFLSVVPPPTPTTKKRKPK